MVVTSLKFCIACIVLLGCVVAASAQQPDDEEEGLMRFRFVGPKVGNRIASVAGIPGDPSTYYAGAASGGIFKSIDGGNAWLPIFDSQPVAAIGALAVAPSNPSIVWAGTGEAWAIRDSDVIGDGVYKSTDAGRTWTHMGLDETGRIGRIIVNPENADNVFVCAVGRTTGPQQERGVYRTNDDGGTNWRVVNWDRALIGRAGYYIRLAVSPANENEVLVANSSFHQSVDGGETFRSVPWGGDTHDIWWDTKDPDRFVITHDAGMNITTVHGRGFNRVTLPIGQMYHVAVDNQVPYWVYGNMQDSSSTMRGPSTSGLSGGGFGGARREDIGWERNMGGCESGFTIPDPTDPNIVWATCYGSEVTRLDAETKLARSVSPWLHTLDSPPNDAKYRCHWTPPLAIDPFDHNTVYFSCQVIFKTSNGGQSWNVISPDLSTQDPKRVVPSGGIVGDNLGQFYGEVVFSICPSQIQKGLILAGNNDGLGRYTKDGGAHWTNVTKNIAGMPAWGTIASIEPSHFDAGTAYISVDLHLMDNRDPYLYKTTDFGQTWKPIATGLPKHPLGSARV